MEEISPLQQLLQRTSLDVSFDVFLQFLEKEFPVLGKIQQSEPIIEGYEAANILITTSTGKFVVKLFESNRNLQNMKDTVSALQKLEEIGVPMTHLIEGKHGVLIEYPSAKPLHFFVMKFAEGKNFEEQPVTLDDMKKGAEFVAKIDTLDLHVLEAYDSWGSNNLAKEYEAHSLILSFEEKATFFPIIKAEAALDTSTFSKSFIHGDMQRKHVIKDDVGNYTILDLGCMRYDLKLYDLANYLAWFCFDETNWEKKDEILQLVLSTYGKLHTLSEAELAALPLLTRASYAAYYMQSSLLLRSGDDSEETNDWYNSAWDMLELTEDWK